jgi:hypothetical protein
MVRVLSSCQAAHLRNAKEELLGRASPSPRVTGELLGRASPSPRVTGAGADRYLLAAAPHAAAGRPEMSPLFANARHLSPQQPSPSGRVSPTAAAAVGARVPLAAPARSVMRFTPRGSAGAVGANAAGGSGATGSGPRSGSVGTVSGGGDQSGEAALLPEVVTAGGGGGPLNQLGGALQPREDSSGADDTFAFPLHIL